MSRLWSVRRRLATVGLAALLGAGCSSTPAPTGYSIKVRSAFLAACGSTGRQGRGCLCAYQSFERTIPFPVFKRVNDDLSKPDASVPRAFVIKIRDCEVQGSMSSGG